MNPFELPINVVEVRRGERAYIYKNGCINISGISYYGYSLTEAKRVHARKYPRKRKLTINN
jgi:hypothetical protein